MLGSVRRASDQENKDSSLFTLLGLLHELCLVLSLLLFHVIIIIISSSSKLPSVAVSKQIMSPVFREDWVISSSDLDEHD